MHFIALYLLAFHFLHSLECLDVLALCANPRIIKTPTALRFKHTNTRARLCVDL